MAYHAFVLMGNHLNPVRIRDWVDMKLALEPSNDWARRLKKLTRNLSELESRC